MALIMKSVQRGTVRQEAGLLLIPESIYCYAKHGSIIKQIELKKRKSGRRKDKVASFRRIPHYTRSLVKILLNQEVS
jgi:hypothetical protein